MPRTSKSAKQPSYEALKSELDKVMAELQREDLDVDAALDYYRRGLELVGQLQAYLETAENTLTELQAKAGPAAK